MRQRLLSRATALDPLSGAPSVFFDAVAVLAGTAGDKMLAGEPDAVSFLMDAYRHLKAIAMAGVPILSSNANVSTGKGVLALNADAVASFIEQARNGKVWEREDE